jgi:hypothetical protein
MIATLPKPAALLRVLAVTTVTFAAVMAVAAAHPGASTAMNCKPPKYPGSGYFTSLKVVKVSCATGKRVTLAHYRCRVRHGAAGHCRSRVRGYRCTERRTTISTEIDAIVTCRHSDTKVVYSYQQNT